MIRSISSYRSVAAPGSVTGVLQEQDQEPRSVRERYRSVAGAWSGTLQRPGALQEHCRGRIRCLGQDLWRWAGTRIVPGQDLWRCKVSYADRVAGLLQGSDLLRYKDVAGACLVAKYIVLLHETQRGKGDVARAGRGPRSPLAQYRNIIIDQKSQNYPPKCAVRKLFTLLGHFFLKKYRNIFLNHVTI
jgi:hypothetical protein